MVAENIQSVTSRITRCCEKSGRDPDAVALVCVTKAATIAEAIQAIEAGARILGENRVRDAAEKIAAIGDTAAAWHLIGHLQTNKARDAVRMFSLIHSVDSVRLARAIDNEAWKIGKVQDILLQVNISGEGTKFGVVPSAAAGLVREFGAFANIRVAGLMTMAPYTDDPEDARPVFRRLRELKDAIDAERGPGKGLCHLSMGMTGDFEVAVEEGSTLVRIGTAIFGDTGSSI